MTRTPRRIVTGYNESGHAIIQSDGPPARAQVVGKNGPTFHEIWNTRETPALIDRNGVEPAEAQLTLAPPKRGTRIRVLDIPPETEGTAKIDAATAQAHFASIGAPGASTHHAAHSKHPFEGEITLIVDEGETIVRSGDIVVQRGTNHGWANRSGQNCRIAFILIDGQFTEGLG
jgi:hypothetical protein